MEHYDFIALGGGNAGLTASRRVKAAGKTVALIDPTPIGGLCALRGCNPKKVLVRATEVLHLVRAAREHAISTGEVRIDWNAVIDRKHTFTDPITGSTEKSLRDAGIDYIRAPARFTAPDRLEVDGRTISFGGVTVATGSSPRRFMFPGADQVSSSDEILEARVVPSRLVIIGAGVVAFEFAHVFARLGSSVHVLNRGTEALKGHDRDLVRHLVKHMQGLGVTFHAGVEVESVTRNATAHEVHLSGGTTLRADFVLNAAGRPPSLAGLALEKAQVKYDARGVEVNEYLRSPGNPRVFAAGDAHGKRELSPVASHEGAIVAHNFLHGDEKRADYSAIPSAVFTVPAFAAVGLTEAQAREERLSVDVVMEDMSEWTVVRIAAEKPSFAKVISDKHSSRILGAHLFGPSAAENIHIFAMAMRYGITRSQLAEMVYVYPTIASTLSHLSRSPE